MARELIPRLVRAARRQPFRGFPLPPIKNEGESYDPWKVEYSTAPPAVDPRRTLTLSDVGPHGNGPEPKWRP